MTTEYYLSIDPGTETLGWAHCSTQGGQAHYINSGIEQVKASTEKDWLTRCDIIVEMMYHQSMQFRVTDRLHHILIELPTVFQTEKGQAASNSGAVMKVFGQVMMLRSILRTVLPDPSRVMLVTPNTWKGQLPKDIVQKRLGRRWGFCPDDHNEADALGIADWYFRDRQLEIRKVVMGREHEK